MIHSGPIHFGEPRTGPTPRQQTPISQVEADEPYMPPVRRDHLRLAREARARATDDRVYWTNRGLIQGKATSVVSDSEKNGKPEIHEVR